MNVLAPGKLTSVEARRLGAYLEDGKRLFRVVDAQADQVRLENCAVPGENPAWFPVEQVLKTMRLARS